MPIVDGTVPYDTKVKYKAASLMLHPAAEGTGIIAGGPARRILDLAGFKNVLAKRYGSTNIITNAYAAMKALQSFAYLDSASIRSNAKSEEKPDQETKKAVAAKKKPAEKK